MTITLNTAPSIAAYTSSAPVEAAIALQGGTPPILPPRDPVIRSATVDEVLTAPGFPELIAEYRAEASLNPDLQGDPDPDYYRMVETSGKLATLGAFIGGRIVGFATVLVTTTPICRGRPVGVVEAVFMTAEYRARGAGLRLLRAVEDAARAKGAVGMYANGPVSGRLPKVLNRTGYAEVSRAFYKSFA